MADFIEKCPECGAYLCAHPEVELKCRFCGSTFALFDGKWRKVGVEIVVKGKPFEFDADMMEEMLKPGRIVQVPEHIEMEFPRPFSVKGLKSDKSKPDWSLMPLAFVAPLIPIFEHGAREYGRDNWRKPFDDESNRFIAAIKRHLLEIDNGKPFAINALDSGVYHAAQIAWNALRLIWSVAGGGK